MIYRKKNIQNKPKTKKQKTKKLKEKKYTKRNIYETRIKSRIFVE
jgi:hypothetical protein